VLDSDSTTPGRVYMASLCVDGATPGGTEGICVSASADGGQTFAVPVTVAVPAAGGNCFDQEWMAVNPFSGDLYIVYRHIAAACGTPVVVTYAQTNPQHTPWKVPSRVLSREVPCKNCLKSRCPFVDHPCLLGIDEHEVAAAALDLLAEARASRAAADPSTRAARAA